MHTSRSHITSRRARAACLTMLLAAAPLAAQGTPAPSSPAAVPSAAASPLVLGELYREARQASPRGEAARALARAAEARVPGARRPPDPELQLGFMNYTLPGLRPMEPLGMTQLQLMQMLPTAGKLGLSGRVAAAQAAAQSERATEVGWEVRNDVAMAFYDLYQTEQTLEVDRRTLRLVQDIRQTAEAMYRVGEGRQADVLRANVEIARMVEDTIRMATMRTAMAARLAALLDRPADSPVGSPALPEFPDSVPELATLLAQAADGRAMVKAGQREVEAAEAQSTLARREIWPDLTVGIQYGQSRVTMPAGTDAEGMPMPAERRTERMGSLMVGATLPIFARSRQLRMREEMTAMRRMAEADLASMRAETRGGVAQAHANLLRARRLAALYRTTVIPQAEATVQSSLAAYRVGSVDFMTLLDNRMAVNEYQQQLLALEAEEGKAWAELEMLVGRELLDANSVAAGRAVAGGAR
ncbi:MAG TPA: TolC family protein [Gemmatimonadaceae bacterium]|nr:TolC family protein [Gemmatimonadaceae bacterium]